jgi:hypothetical protein
VHTDTFANGYSHSDGHGDGYANTDSNSHGDGYANPDSDSHVDSDGYGHGDIYAVYGEHIRHSHLLPEWQSSAGCEDDPEWFVVRLGGDGRRG